MEKLKQDVIWEAKVKRSDLGQKDDEEINQMIVELNLAFQSICWAHGLHN
jgi:hypothetical protein